VPPGPTTHGAHEAVTVGGRLGGGVRSRIVTTTEDGLPGDSPSGSAPSATVNVSSSRSASRAVVTVPVPVVCPPPMAMLASEP